FARATLEEDDKALVSKTYTVQAGISQTKPENFEGEPFDLPVYSMDQPILFDVSIHTSENIELTSEWEKTLRYAPRNVEPQLVEFIFRVIAPGRSSLVIDFCHERRWFRTTRLEFDAIEQLQLTTISSEG